MEEKGIVGIRILEQKRIEEYSKEGELTEGWIFRYVTIHKESWISIPRRKVNYIKDKEQSKIKFLEQLGIKI